MDAALKFGQFVAALGPAIVDLFRATDGDGEKAATIITDRSAEYAENKRAQDGKADEKWPRESQQG